MVEWYYNGYGKQTWANGTSYEGYFVTDRSGEGLYNFESGTKHNGTWANGTLVKGTKILKKQKWKGLATLTKKLVN